MKYQLTQEQFEQLHRDLDAGRLSNPVVKVNRAALQALLQDYSALYKEEHEAA